MNYVDTLKQVFTNPKEHFSNLDKENLNYSSPYLFYLLFGAIVFSLNVLVTFLEYDAVGSSGTPIFNTGAVLLFIAVIGLGFLLIAPFLYSVLVHLGVLLLGKKSGFQKTFNAITYAMPVTAVYGVAVAIISLLTVLLLPPDSMITFIPAVLTSILGLASLIHVLYTEIVGISKMHNLSLGWSAACVLIPYILFGILIFAAMFVFFFFAALSAGIGW